MYEPHKELRLCCLLTVSGPVIACVASVFSRVVARKLLTFLLIFLLTFFFCPKKKLQTTSITLKLCLSTDEDFCFLENVNLEPNIESNGPQEDENVAKKKLELSASVESLSFEVSHAARQFP